MWRRNRHSGLNFREIVNILKSLEAICDEFLINIVENSFQAVVEFLKMEKYCFVEAEFDGQRLVFRKGCR